MGDENSRDAGLTAKEEMERVMKETLDRLNREIDERFARLHDTDTKFGFLLDVGGLCYGAAADCNDLKEKCENWANCTALTLIDSSYTKKFWIAECCYQVGPT